jgi:hypothetical protein
MAARDDMAKYMREWRARKRAERLPVVDATLPRDAIAKASPAELTTVRAKLAATPDGVITKSFDKSSGAARLDVMTRQAFEDRRATLLSAIAPRDAPSRLPPPKSLLAIGGKAGKGRALAGYDPQRAPLGAEAIELSVNTVHMLGVLAARSDAFAARSDMLERRVAQLEAREAERVAATKARAGRFIDAGLKTLRIVFGAA